MVSTCQISFRVPVRAFAVAGEIGLGVDLVLVAGVGVRQPLDRLQRAPRLIEIDVGAIDAHDARDRRVVLFFFQIRLAARIVGGFGGDPEAAEFHRQSGRARSGGKRNSEREYQTPHAAITPAVRPSPSRACPSGCAASNPTSRGAGRSGCPRTRSHSRTSGSGTGTAGSRRGDKDTPAWRRSRRGERRSGSG